MSTPNESGKVVDLQARANLQQLTPERAQEILKALRATLIKRVGGIVSSMFDSVDDALFDMAEKADNNAIQTKYFDGMREVRKRRPSMEKMFNDNFWKALESMGVARRDDASAAKPAMMELSLVAEGDLEEDLAISSMCGKAENRLARSLFALNQRFTVLSLGNKVSDADNPLAPRGIAKAFQTTLGELEVDIQVKLIVLKLFDKHVMAALDALYDEVNLQLIDMGVLPQLKHTMSGVRRPPSAPSAPGATPAEAAAAAELAGAPGAAGAAGEYGAGAPMDASMQEMYNSLRNMLAARHPGGGGAVITGPVYQQNDLVNALSILQNQVLALQQQAMGMSTPLQISQIKEELLQQAQKISGGDQHRVHSADEDTIDLVGMLFEFILQDKNLPAEIQALLARLQIPYLKVAIMDKHMFARKEHPARKLLDELAHAGMAWTEEADKDRRLIEKIKAVVEQLLREFDDNLGIFEQLLREFQDFIAGNKKRAEVAEQRTAETARGREKLQAARKLAAREILARLEGKKIPEIIRHTLTRPWANVLVLTILRQGETSPAYKSALRVADELAWSGMSKSSDEERARLRALIPELERALRHGLSMVAYQESDIQQLLSELTSIHQRLLNNNAAADFDAFELVIEDKRPDGASLPVGGGGDGDNFVDEIVVGATAEEEEGKSAPDDEFVQLARNVKIGTWIEFRDERGNVERAKLSWVSPISAKYLFVNRKGLKVADKTVWGLATELRNKRAQILEDVPLFDRALDAIVERLKTTGSADAPAAATEAAVAAPAAG
ncbi:MAG: DUF1631 domain-containing protein [Xanthomonadales bacterium]|jgi:hypothetical protein|nr:DUF1631 domain-containing protein [Xanthomonadales bacterium]